MQSTVEKSLPSGSCCRAVGRNKLWVRFPGVRQLLNNGVLFLRCQLGLVRRGKQVVRSPGAQPVLKKVRAAIIDLTALGALMGVGEWVRKAARVGLWGWGCQESPRRKPAEGGTCCRTGGAGQHPRCFLLWSHSGRQQGPGQGREVPPDQEQGRRSEEVEAQGGLGGEPAHWGLSLG